MLYKWIIIIIIITVNKVLTDTRRVHNIQQL